MTARERITIDVGAYQGVDLAPDLWGLFIEDLNDALDGGLNAERVRNGDFEFSAADRAGWGPLTAWSADDPDRVEVRTDAPIHPNNAHYIRVAGPAALANEGWDGVGATAGQEFLLSFFARAEDGSVATLTAAIGTGGGDLARAQVAVPRGGWRRCEARLAAVADGRGELRIEVPPGLTVDLDHVSLRPAGPDGRPLTFRPDLLQALKDLRPSFIRFPGGCVAHGNGLDNMYHWKTTIGPRHERAQIPNLWGYHQSRQIGYLEYFELCQATGATPLPVVAAGVCCQNTPGGPRAIDDADMDDYIQDVLDLVEFANGPATTRWGARRAELGHPEPFGLRYLGVGNEDEITDDFRDRYARIEDAVRARHPGICVIGTAGPQPFGPDFEAGWAFARARGTAMVDEHGYRNPRWFHQNVDRYGGYAPGPQVYVGEYAARSSTVRSALAEAAYMIGLERHPGVVRLASYAPLLARTGHTQWVPDLIYFTATEVLTSASYHVQRMFSGERGTRLHPVTLGGVEPEPVALPESGSALLRSPGAAIDYTGITLDGRPLPAAGTGPEGEAVELGGIDPAAATLEFTAIRRDGGEGFVVRLGEKAPGSFLDVQIGAWRNKSTCVVRGDDGITDEDHGPLPWHGVRTGVPVRVTVRLEGARVRVWVDGELRHDFEQDLRPEHRVVAGAASRTGSGGAPEYVVRVVNAHDVARVASVTLPEAPGRPATAVVTTLAGAGPDDGAPFAGSPVTPAVTTIAGQGGGVELDLPPWSFVTAVVTAI
ncbi:alpha-L-arabinofuranosidase C-terminal domain-containing protein [Nonomuraea sp. SYSU D8015]|uniref:alpha-L-arabinofuranosidase C-terminal domain-containing protein n=1 Tax=Nonomuraea sp. SYSU D8015 TaxID=2593644 RepID=UPI001661733D|nr:alpha-L-arabinofuranosidase C-terminal domain-containing protein [Nonomuraea sp. SYSU D8015]